MKPVSVVILAGSKSDLSQLEDAYTLLEQFQIPFEANVSSAHRTPEKTRKLIRDAERRGAKVIIACAGMAAHLAGVAASETLLPVIGVPMVVEPFRGMDSLLSTLQMPAGVPVATVTVGKAGSTNAVVLAAEILALSDPRIKDRLRDYRRQWIKSVEKGAGRSKQD